MWDFERETLIRITYTHEENDYPVWTPDGLRIAFFSTRSGAPGIYWKAADTTGSVESLLDGRQGELEGIVGHPYAFSPAGTELIFRRTGHPDTGTDIGMIALDGEAKPVWLLHGAYDEQNAELSPGGRWLAYQSNESGRWEIYVRPFPNVDGGKWQISNAGGRMPLWSRDGRELFFLSLQVPGELMVVSVETGSAFDYARPRALLAWPYVSRNQPRTYAVSPDGQRFLVLKPVRTDTDIETSVPTVNVVLNWFEELKERAPVP